MCARRTWHLCVHEGNLCAQGVWLCAQGSDLCAQSTYLWLNYVLGWYIRVKISVDYDSTLLQIIWKFINNCTHFHHGYVKLTKPGICDTFFVIHFQSPINFKLRHIHIHIIATIYLYNYILILNDCYQLCQLRQCLALQITKSTHNQSK